MTSNEPELFITARIGPPPQDYLDSVAALLADLLPPETTPRVLVQDNFCTLATHVAQGEVELAQFRHALFEIRRDHPTLDMTIHQRAGIYQLTTGPQDHVLWLGVNTVPQHTGRKIIDRLELASQDAGYPPTKTMAQPHIRLVAANLDGPGHIERAKTAIRQLTKLIDLTQWTAPAITIIARQESEAGWQEISP